MTSFTVNAILEETVKRDKDYRYMATSDLLLELQKDSFKPDTDGERKICKALLKLLNDQSSDVQGLAVKCLSPLVRKVHDAQVDEVMVALCNSVLTGKEEQRDICAIGLKTVVLEMPVFMGATAVRQLVPRLVQGVRDDALEVKLECIDILSDVLKRFGSLLKPEASASCNAALFAQLESTRAATRKRAISCIAALSAALSDKLLGQLVASIVCRLEEPSVELELRRTYIQTLSAISRSGGYRLGRQLEIVMPLILRQCSPDFTATAVPDPEMIESCLQAFESFVLRCPNEVGAYEDAIARTSLHYLAFDPNYADDDEMGGEEEEEETMQEEEEDDDDYSDDDDISWKVRRAAAKVLSAAIISRPDKLPSLVPLVAPTLIARFREREENVKTDVFSTFNDLLAQIGASNRAAAEAASPDEMAVDEAGAPPSPAAAALLAEVPKLVRAISRQLKEKAVKTRTAAFHCLRMLAGSLPGCLGEHAVALVPGVTRALKETSANPLRLEVLAFLQLALATHHPAVWQPHCATLVPAVLVLVDDRYYKITAESLRVTAELIRVLRPAPPEVGFDFAPHVAPIFAVVRARLDAQDQDQEVKECAIETMGLTICHLGDACAEALPGTMPVLLERLRNEITRITAVKTFALLAAAKLDAKLSSPLNGSTVLQAVVAELASFLRKSNKPLRQASLSALEVIVTHHSASLRPADYDEILSQMPPLLSDADLHVAHLALVLAATVVHRAAALTVPRLGEAVVPRALALLTSPLLQGYALKSALDFFAALVAHNAPALDFGTVSSKLLELAATDAAGRSRHTLGVLSQAVAVCATMVPQPAKRAAMVDAFIKQLGQPSPHGQVLALLCLGEIGQRNDLSAHAPLLDAILAVFDSNSEDFKAAAAYALGNVAAGNLPFYLPQLLRHIEKGKHEYLMLAALKELAVSGAVVLAGFAEQMLPCLFVFAEREEEGVRNVAAECVGRLAAAAPGAVLPALEARLAHPSAHVRAVVVNSLRFTLNEPGVHLPAPLVGRFLGALNDQDLKVRRGALLTLNCLANNRPAAIRDALSVDLLPMLYSETEKKPELVHQVDLGPFKHTVDDGLELRKAAFECMDTLLETSADRLELQAFVSRLVDGLSDDHDIRLLCHAMLGKLAATPSAAPVLLSSLEAIVDPLRKTICATLKDNAVPQQIERHDELVRSGMRAVRALEKMPDADGQTKFDEFVRTTLKGGKLADKYSLLCAEEETKPADEAS